MYQKLVTLKWKYLIPNLSSGLSDVFTENSFSDVTLVSDDKLQFQAHKFVLSASSPLLKNILLDNTHPHPLIYLRGVKHQELKSILQFIYLGEASIYQCSMNRLIQAAKDLEIKQLAENVIVGNPCIASREDADLHISSNNDEISNHEITANTENVEEEAQYTNDGRSISSIADEIINLNIPANIPGGDKVGCDEQTSLVVIR